MREILKRVLSEPLLHFLVLGAGLFAMYGMASETVGGGGTGRIVVTRGQIEQLASTFAKTWQRPPTPEELLGLVRGRIREEVYVREATALGLDQDDTIIRRRLQQKMEFITNDLAAESEPTDAELTAYLQAHPDSFRLESRFTFHQVYLNPERHGSDTARAAAELLAQLQRAGDQADPAKFGDPSVIEHQFTALSLREVALHFGQIFADKLPELTPRQWQGPVESGYGAHLVMVTEHAAGRLPALDEVRDTVRREWDNSRRLEANEKFYQALLERYTVTIESLDEAPTGQGQVAANEPR